MERLLEIVFKVAEAHPKTPPLTASRKAFIRDRLSKFTSSCETPDHPPYSAMIEKALEELNDKNGSTEDSISQFLQGSYCNLPMAHPAFLKHHLAKLCESGYIDAVRGKRYMLAPENRDRNLSTKVERKPKMKRKQPKHYKVDLIEKHEGPNEDEPKLIEYRVRSEGKQVEPSQIKRLPSGYPQERRELRRAQKDSPEESTPEGRLGLEFVGGERMSVVNSKSTHDLRQLSHCSWNKRLAESRLVVTASEFPSDSGSPMNQRKIVEQCGSLEADVIEVPQSAACSSKFKKMKVYTRRNKRNLEQSETVTTDASLNLHPLSNVQESQHAVQDLSPLRRSVRRRVPTYRVAEDGNDADISKPREGSRTFHECQSGLSKRRLCDCEHHADKSELPMQKRKLKHTPVSECAAGDERVEELKRLRKPNGETEQVLLQKEEKRPRLVIRLAQPSGKMHKDKTMCDKEYLSVVLALGHPRNKTKTT